MKQPESNNAAEWASGSLKRTCYVVGERVMAKHHRWGWIPCTVRWQSETTISLITESIEQLGPYLITVPLEDVKPHNARTQRPGIAEATTATKADMPGSLE